MWRDVFTQYLTMKKTRIWKLKDHEGRDRRWGGGEPKSRRINRAVPWRLLVRLPCDLARHELALELQLRLGWRSPSLSMLKAMPQIGSCGLRGGDLRVLLHDPTLHVYQRQEEEDEEKEEEEQDHLHVFNLHCVPQSFASSDPLQNFAVNPENRKTTR